MIFRYIFILYCSCRTRFDIDHHVTNTSTDCVNSSVIQTKLSRRLPMPFVTITTAIFFIQENIQRKHVPYLEIVAALAFIGEKSRGIFSPRGIFKTFKSQENFSPFLLILWDSLRFVQTLPPPREVLSISRDLQTNFINKP